MYGAPNYPKKAQGGPVEGPGTGTSDSIKKEVPVGSFIMPADSTARLGLNPEAIKRYKESLAAKDADLPRLGARKNVPVNLSNGEYEVPPEQVHAVGVEALNQVKDATHTPTEARGFDLEAFKRYKQEQENMPRLGFNPEMAQQYKAQQSKEQFFADGGVVDDPDKRKRSSFDITNTPTARGGLSPQGVQGMARDAASKPAGGLPAYSAPKQPTFADGLAGGAKAIAGFGSVVPGAIADAGRAGLTLAVGGDPGSQEGGARKYTDAAVGLGVEGWNQAGGAAERLRAVSREALGVQSMATPVAQPTVETPVVGGVSPYNGQQRPAKAELPRLGEPGWNKTGVGAGGAGGEIASRVGANGVPEFTNDAEAVASAQDLPRLGVGADRLKTAGISNMADDVPFEKRGSINNVGNGVGGGISYGEAGDAKLAIERFGRANDIREQAIAEQSGTGRVTGITDNSRAPTLAERQRAKVDQRQAQTEATRAQTQQNASEINQRIAADTQRMQTEQLNQQRLQQELASGQFSVQDRQRIAELQARMVDPSLSEEERTSAREGYEALVPQGKGRYIEVRGGTDAQGAKAASMVFDTRTGQYVAAPGAPSLPAGVDRERALSDAKAAIDSGVSRDAVNQRLAEWGLEPL